MHIWTPSTFLQAGQLAPKRSCFMPGTINRWDRRLTTLRLLFLLMFAPLQTLLGGVQCFCVYSQRRWVGAQPSAAACTQAYCEGGRYVNWSWPRFSTLCCPSFPLHSAHSSPLTGTAMHNVWCWWKSINFPSNPAVYRSSFNPIWWKKRTEKKRRRDRTMKCHCTHYRKRDSLRDKHAYKMLARTLHPGLFLSLFVSFPTQNPLFFHMCKVKV